MEGSETPKGIAESGNKELESKATELANDTRMQGIGGLYGKFPRVYLERLGRGDQTGQQTHVGGFRKGKEGRSPLNPYKVEHMGYANHYSNRQIWEKNSYAPMETKEESQLQETSKTVRHLGGLIKRTQIEKKLVTVKIPTPIIGYNGWKRYDYYMPAYNDKDMRSGIFVMMSLAVPPEIAAQIDEQVEKNPYFPDAYFKALYPDLTVGEDVKQHLKRKPATEIEVVDNTKRLSRQVRKYPTPIPY